MLVAGAGVTGKAVLQVAAGLGTEVTVCDDNSVALQQLSNAMTTADATARITQFDLVVTSPGFPPAAPVLAAAAAAGVPIWGDVELAWRLDASGMFGPPRRWLVVTGTNG
jgi:UDP-N-acetylmuramoylalanine--D-glutamate ligase